VGLLSCYEGELTNVLTHTYTHPDTDRYTHIRTHIHRHTHTDTDRYTHIHTQANTNIHRRIHTHT
jgi:hypothetical protein